MMALVVNGSRTGVVPCATRDDDAARTKKFVTVLHRIHLRLHSAQTPHELLSILLIRSKNLVAGTLLGSLYRIP